jgi:hypothetical protein
MTASQAAQQAGAAGAKEAGEIQKGQMAATQQGTVQVEQAKQQEQARQYSLALGQLKQRQDKHVEQRVQHMAKLGKGVKEKLFDAHMRFEESERGRKFTNDTQLLDHSVAMAKNQQEAERKFQQIQQFGEKKIQVMQIVHQRLMQSAKQGYLSMQQKLDHDHQKRIQQLAADIQKQIKKEQRKANSRAQMFKGGGMLVGIGVAAAITIGTGGTGAPIAWSALAAGGMVGGAGGEFLGGATR